MRSKKKTLRNLRSALKNRNVDQVRDALRFQPKLRSSEGAQMLWSVVMENTEIASMLVRAGANLAERNPTDNSTLLLYASSRSSSEEYQNLALLMLEHGANVNPRTRAGDTALHLAARNGSVPLVEALVERGLSVDIANAEEETAICAAAKGSRAKEMLRLMVEQHSIDAGKRNRRLLDAIEFLICCESDESVAIGELLDLGVDVNERSGCGLMPISLAVARGKKKLIAKLMHFGPNMKRLIKDSHLSVIRSSYFEQDLFVKLIRIEDAANINERNEYGRTRLHELCAWSKYMHPRNMQLLLHLGADVNALDDLGNTPFALMPTDSLDNMRQLFLKHMAILFWKGAIFSDGDMAILRNDLKAGRFYEECLDELLKMKETVVYEDFSVFDFFVKSAPTVSTLARSRHFVAGYEEKKILFPIYQIDLEIAFNLAKARRDVLLLAEMLVSSMTNRVLPRRAVEKITVYVCFDKLREMQRTYYFKLWAETNVREVVDDKMIVN